MGMMHRTWLSLLSGLLISTSAYAENESRSTYEFMKALATGSQLGITTGLTFASLIDDQSISLMTGMAIGEAVGISTVLIADLHGNPLPAEKTGTIASGQLVGLSFAVPQLFLASSFIDDHEPAKPLINGLLLAGQAAGIGGGFLLMDQKALTPGQSSAISASALWGMGLMTSMTASIVSSANDGDWSDSDLLVLWGMSTLGSIGGAIGGYFLGQIENPSLERVWLSMLGGSVGAAVGFQAALVGYFAADADKWILGTLPTVGAVAGLTLGWWLSSSVDKSPNSNNAISRLQKNIQFGIAPSEEGALGVLYGQF